MCLPLACTLYLLDVMICTLPWLMPNGFGFRGTQGYAVGWMMRAESTHGVHPPVHAVYLKMLDIIVFRAHTYPTFLPCCTNDPLKNVITPIT